MLLPVPARVELPPIPPPDPPPIPPPLPNDEDEFAAVEGYAFLFAAPDLHPLRCFSKLSGRNVLPHPGQATSDLVL
jgi:hypothetical protein